MTIIKLLEKLGEESTSSDELATEFNPEEVVRLKSTVPDIVCMIAPAEDDDEEQEDVPQEEPKETPKEEKQA